MATIRFPFRKLKLTLLALLAPLVLLGSWLTLTAALRGPVEESTSIRAAREKLVAPMDEMMGAMSQVLVQAWLLQQAAVPSAEWNHRAEALKNQAARFEDFRGQFERAAAGTEFESSAQQIDEKWKPVYRTAHRLLEESRPAESASLRSLPSAIEVLASTLEDTQRTFDETEVEAGAWPYPLDRRLATAVGLTALALLSLSLFLLRSLTRTAAPKGADWQEATRELAETLGQLAVTHHRLGEWASVVLAELDTCQHFLGETCALAKVVDSQARDAVLQSDVQAGLTLGNSAKTEEEKNESSWMEVANWARKAQHAIEGADTILFQLDLLAVNLGVEAARARSRTERGTLAAADAIRDLTGKTAASLRDARSLIAQSAAAADHGMASLTVPREQPQNPALSQSMRRTSQLSREIVERCLAHLSRLSLSRRSAETWSECEQISSSVTEKLQKLLDRIQMNVDSRLPDPALAPENEGKVLTLSRELIDKPMLGDPSDMDRENSGLKAGGIF